MSPPPTIPDYELIRAIGSGAYGQVWLARGVTGVFRAIKIISRSNFADEGPFEREFRGLKEFAAISVQEPTQLAVLHVGRNEEAGFFYYVMELADDVRSGSVIDPHTYVPASLAQRRAERPRLSAAECLEMGLALAQALRALHARGLVHRDIKPANIVFVEGKPKLADIGLVSPAAAALTYVGTDGYIPPEGPGTAGADIFSLGRVLYEAATGLKSSDFPRLPPELAADPDYAQLAALNPVILRAADHDRTRRYPDAESLLRDLERLAQGRKVRAHSVASGRRRSLQLMAIAGMVALLLGIGWLMRRQPAAAGQSEAARLTEQARHLSRMLNYRESDLAVADAVSQRATDLEPTSAPAWGARAWVQAAFIYRQWDDSSARKQSAEEFANRALSLDPMQPDALIAKGVVLNSNNAGTAAEPLLRRAMELLPEDTLPPRLLAWALLIQNRAEEGRKVVLETARRFPNDPLAVYEAASSDLLFYIRKRDPAYLRQGIETFHRLNELHPTASVLTAEIRLALTLTGDFADLRTALAELEKFPLDDRSDDRAVYWAAMGYLEDHRPERVSAITALSARRYLDDNQANQPRAWLDALAQQQLGNAPAARGFWEDAAAVLQQKVSDSASDPEHRHHYVIQLATTLVLLGRTHEADLMMGPVLAVTGKGPAHQISVDLARYYLARGDGRRALNYSPAFEPWGLKLDPWWAPARGLPEFPAAVQALLKRLPPLN